MRPVLAALLIALVPSVVPAQSNPRYIPFQGAAKGALYVPDTGPAPRVAVLLMHRTSNFLSAPACRELSARGFMVLCMNPRSDNSEALVRWEQNPLDVKAGVEFLRKQPGIAKVVLWGHSGGGATMTFYQDVAEHGPSVCQGPNKLVQCGDELKGLPPADGIVLVDAHPGNPVNILRNLNPAVVTEGDPAKIDPALDPFDPKNGFNPNGPSKYSAEFKARYFKAQSARMNRLIDDAQARMKAIQAGTYRFPDDDAFLVVSGNGARIMEFDPGIHESTLQPRRLLKNDGTVVTEIVHSVRTASTDRDENRSFQGMLFLTLRSFLSANATRSTDALDGIDVCSSNNSVPCHAKGISVPVLVTAMGGHYFIRDNEISYEAVGSADKEYIVIEGATHGLTPCKACEKTPGQYGKATENLFNYVRDWINTRFAK